MSNTSMLWDDSYNTYSQQVWEQLNAEADAFASLTKGSEKVICPNCKNVEMSLLGARGGNTNQTTEIWMCPQCNQMTYNSSYLSFTFPNTTSSSGYTITLPPQYQQIPTSPNFESLDRLIEAPKHPVEIPIECPVCNDLFSNHREYDEHIENEHKWMLGGTIHEEDEEDDEEDY